MMNRMKTYRIEKDASGTVKVPALSYFGAQTQRAVENFPISGLKPHLSYIYATVIVKKAAAIVHAHLTLLSEKKGNAIVCACNEILAGKFTSQFVVDPYQAGAGTSFHMNVNEVIANRANELLGAPRGTYTYIHPNDEVNMSQSTNDVIPTAIRIAALQMIIRLLQSIDDLSKSFINKAKEFEKIIKAGRTHLQDALPITLGQEFGTYAYALQNDKDRIQQASIGLLRIGIGGTAVGTGVNTHKKYQKLMVTKLRRLTKFPLVSSKNLFESMQFTADFLDLSACLRTLASSLIKIGNDLRLLSSGPKTGFAEIKLPEVQAGSSIMPGKINPSIIEMLTMVCFQVIGYDQAILLATSAGQLELNVMLPLIAYDLLEQIRLLTNAIKVFNEKCVKGITVDEEMCRYWSERSSGIAAVLNPYLGYDTVAKLVTLSIKTNKALKDIVVEKGYLTKQKIDEIFEIKNLTRSNR